MTTSAVAQALGCGGLAIINTAKYLLPDKVIDNGKPTMWNEAEVAVIKKPLEKQHNKNSISTYTVDEKRMTTSAVAAALGCEVKTIFNNAKVCLPAKKIENGKPTLWNEAEVSMLLEYMKRNTNNQHELVSRLQGKETALTPALELEALYRRIDAIKTAEIERLQGENEGLLSELDRAKEWAGVLLANKKFGTSYGSVEGKKLSAYSRVHGYEIRQAYNSRLRRYGVYHKDVWRAVYGLDITKEGSHE